mgnify:CR=1 FL=1
MSKHTLVSPVVIIGAGHAGGAAAFELRRAGFAGPVVLLGAEAHGPYQRPPLSKAWLKGDASPEDIWLRDQAWYAEADVELRLKTQVVAIDRQEQVVTLEGGEALPYGQLILATGVRSRPLPLPGHALAGIYQLRDLSDAEALKAALAQAETVTLVGGGYIGLEVAAVARSQGKAVRVLEADNRLMRRTASAELAAHMARVHSQRDVDLRLGAQVVSFDGTDHVEGVTLANGETLPTDLVIVAVGAVANDDLARDAGLACDQGVVVDAQARTEDPHIFAIGDVAVRPFDTGPVRLESVHNALEQAKQVAAHITGRPLPRLSAPWFWSDQYDQKIQIAGLMRPGLRPVVRQDGQQGPLSVFHLAGQQLVCVEAVNAPADYMAGKLMLEKGVPVRADQLADVGQDLRTLLQPA